VVNLGLLWPAGPELERGVEESNDQLVASANSLFVTVFDCNDNLRERLSFSIFLPKSLLVSYKLGSYKVGISGKIFPGLCLINFTQSRTVCHTQLQNFKGKQFFYE
jgi:hypothetical protein